MAENQAQETQAAAEAVAESGSILDQILEQTNVTPSDGESYALAQEGVKAFMRELFKPDRAGVKVEKSIVDDMIRTIDQRLSKQVDEVLHHEQFQKLESAWRGLRLVVERTNFRENVKIEMMNCSKEDLKEDFDVELDITKTGMYRRIYSAEYGTFGGQPYGAIIANYDFGPGAQDISLLQKCAAVATMSHAPFIAAVDPKFFGSEDFTTLPNMKDIKSILESPKYVKWQAFRESEDARSVGLTMPRFLLRLPYGGSDNPIKAFDYQENVSKKHEDYLWGNTAFAFATRLTDSFAKFRWCPNIIGPKGGGAVEDLPLHQYEAMGDVQTKIPTEVQITERREFELSEEGFIPLTMRKGSDNACFFSANSCQKAKNFGQSPEGKDAETNYRLGTQLPYMFVMSRLAHYLKVLQRENLGSDMERVDLERSLNEWIRQYVADMDNPQPGVRARRPLRQAQVIVEDVEGQPGWYRVDLKVRPHFKYMGAFFTLSLVGKLDKK